MRFLLVDGGLIACVWGGGRRHQTTLRPRLLQHRYLSLFLILLIYFSAPLFIFFIDFGSPLVGALFLFVF
jgi:hypothetical protein